MDYPNCKVVNIIAGPGAGKCLAKDTLVMMHDGSVARVQDIVAGDLIMGDDSKPRTVLTTCSGREEMYKIIQSNGKDYTVNASHILTLMHNGESVDIPLMHYLSSARDEYRGYKVGVEFPSAHVRIDPYIIGCILAESPSGLDITMMPSDENYHHYKLANHRIPVEYLRNDAETRMGVLAGIIDADGSAEYSFPRDANHAYQFSLYHRDESFARDVTYLARSLGLYVTEVVSNVYDGNRYVNIISGSLLSRLPLRRYLHACSNISPNCNIDVESVGEGEYYGFELDGNGRFLLGDFTVTHNTTMTFLLYAKMKIAGAVVEHVPEYAKKLVWAKKFSSLDNQYHVSTKQYENLKSVYGCVQFVITDGSLLHGLYYNRNNPTNVSNVDLTHDKILEYYRDFNNINIYLTRGDFKYEQAGRIQTEDEAKQIDIDLRKILDDNGVEYRVFKSDESVVDEIVNHIFAS